jgi:hypothetical protein
VASALFGGISVTGTIARTATNIRAGALSPFAGMMHAGFVSIFMVVAAPYEFHPTLSTRRCFGGCLLKYGRKKSFCTYFTIGGWRLFC